MESKNEERKKTSEELKLEADISKFTKWGWGFVIVGILFFIVGWVPFLYETEYGFNELGSYLGGTVGSLWALAGLFFIYVAFLGQKVEMLYQREELGYTREELKGTREELRGQREQMTLQNANLRKQNFENTFFNMLSLLNEIIDQVAFDNGITGRISLQKFYSNYKSRFRMYASANSDNNNSTFQFEIINKSYSEFSENFGNRLNPIFNNIIILYQLVESSPDEKNRIYNELILAQLDTHLLCLFFYYSIGISDYDAQIILLNKIPLNSFERLVFSSTHLNLFKEEKFLPK